MPQPPQFVGSAVTSMHAGRNPPDRPGRSVRPADPSTRRDRITWRAAGASHASRLGEGRQVGEGSRLTHVRDVPVACERRTPPRRARRSAAFRTTRRRRRRRTRSHRRRWRRRSAGAGAAAGSGDTRCRPVPAVPAGRCPVTPVPEPVTAGAGWSRPGHVPVPPLPDGHSAVPGAAGPEPPPPLLPPAPALVVPPVPPRAADDPTLAAAAAARAAARASGPRAVPEPPGTSSS